MNYLNYVDKDGNKHRKKIFIINNRKMIKLGKDKYISKNKFLKQQGGGVSHSRVHTELSTDPTPIQPKSRLHSSLHSNIKQKILKGVYATNRYMANERKNIFSRGIINTVNRIILNNDSSAEESFQTLNADKKKSFLFYLKILFLRYFGLYEKLCEIFFHIFQNKDSIKNEIETNSITQRTRKNVINKLSQIKHFVAEGTDYYMSSVPYENVFITRDINSNSFKKLLEICKRILFEINATNLNIEQLNMNNFNLNIKIITYQLNETNIIDIILEFIQKISNLELSDRRDDEIIYIELYVMSYIIKILEYYIIPPRVVII